MRINFVNFTKYLIFFHPRKELTAENFENWPIREIFEISKEVLFACFGKSIGVKKWYLMYLIV